MSKLCAQVWLVGVGLYYIHMHDSTYYKPTPPIRRRCKEDRPWAYNMYYTVYTTSKIQDHYSRIGVGDILS